MSTWLTVGKQIPNLTLAADDGSQVRLAELRGKAVVVYFYPKDDTPGCTREACDFKDNLARLKKEGVVVLGVSKDSLAAHAKFRAKYSLPFDLLVDTGSEVARAYGAYGKKVMYGKEVEGTIRSTFLIDEHGKLARVWSPVKVDGHVAAVLAALTGADEKAKPAPKKAAAKAPAARAKVSEKSGSKPRAAKPAKKA